MLMGGDKGELEHTVASGWGVPNGDQGKTEGPLVGAWGVALIRKRRGWVVVRGVGRWGFSPLDHFPSPSWCSEATWH